MQLAQELNEFLWSKSLKLEKGEKGSYQCLVCGQTGRDWYNMRVHLTIHLTKSPETSDLLARIDQFIESMVFQQDPNMFTCLVCRRQLKMQYPDVRKHFINKHLK